jgi:hypothetical protein
LEIRQQLCEFKVVKRGVGVSRVERERGSGRNAERVWRGDFAGLKIGPDVVEGAGSRE